MRFIEFLEYRDPELYEAMDGAWIRKVLGKMPFTLAALGGTFGLYGTKFALDRHTDNMQKGIDDYNKSIQTEVIPKKSAPNKYGPPRGKVIKQLDNSGDA